jgi:hypothetical protein
VQALSSGSRRAGKVVRIGARISGVSAPLIAAAAIFAGPGCGGEEFCAEGSYECTTAGSSGTGGSSSGTSGQASGGASAEAGNAALGGSSAAGSGGDSGSAGGGFAGMAEGGSSGSGDSGAGGDSGSTGTGGTSGNPVPCSVGDFSEGCTLASSAGLFVSPAGNDDNAGSSDAPLATLTAAIEKARSGSRVLPIFLCTATYREHPEIHNDGYALHGGFACPDDLDAAWVYDSAERAKIAPNTQGYALRVRDLQGLVVSDLEFSAADGEEPGESSIGVFVSNAADVRFERVRITAGDGVDGAPGAIADPFEFADTSELAGNDAIGDLGADRKTCRCDGTSEQTFGGSGGDVGQEGSPGGPQDLSGGTGGEVGASCQNGADGGPAPNVPAADGATRLGTLTADMGWLPGDGGSGQPGRPGKGGGGGSGALEGATGGGGGGACGGCGGNGAAGGNGGGSSVGLLLVDAGVSVTDSIVQSASGGNGGAGVDGQTGQTGGTGGNRTGTACLGGNGGKGADGGASGGGAGGVSVGILWTGDTAPDVSDDTAIDPGEAGLGGTGGDPLENDGIGGVSQEILRLNG